MATYTRPAQAQTRQNSSSEKGKGTQSPLQLTLSEKEEFGFLQWSTTGSLRLTPWPMPGVLGHLKTDTMLICVWF